MAELLSSLRERLPNYDRLAEMFLQSPISIELYDADGKWVTGNLACMTTFGITPEDVTGFDLFTDELVPIDIRHAVRSGQAASFRREFDFSKVTYQTDRTDAPLFEIHFTPLRDITGALTGYLVQTVEVGTDE